jgi:hypothetical protein
MTQNPTLTCLGKDAEGWPCGAEALIHDIEYTYDADPMKFGEPPISVEYVVECPRCGRRTQTVRWQMAS